MNDNRPSPELALSIYASTAATLCVALLRKEGLLKDPELDQLINNLVVTRQATKLPKFVEQHFAILTQILIDATPKGSDPS
ncbi:MAG: hypothetical protein AAFQ27_10090 [Pseudomonadota bacterium]